MCISAAPAAPAALASGIVHTSRLPSCVPAASVMSRVAPAAAEDEEAGADDAEAEAERRHEISAPSGHTALHSPAPERESHTRSSPTGPSCPSEMTAPPPAGPTHSRGAPWAERECSQATENESDLSSQRWACTRHILSRPWSQPVESRSPVERRSAGVGGGKKVVSRERAGWPPRCGRD
jgi:hypothetical protein